MFSIDAQSLPCASSYMDARHVYENAIIWKDEPIWRGLKNRRAKHFLVRECGRTIEFRLYETVLVRWYGDGHVGVVVHDSISSRAFLNCFLPPGLSAIAAQGSTYICTGGQYFTSHEELVFRYVASSNLWVCDNPEIAEPHYSYTTDKRIARMAQTRTRKVVERAKMLDRIGIPKTGSNFFLVPTKALAAELARPVLEDEDIYRLSDHVRTVSISPRDLARQITVQMGGVTKHPLPPGTYPPRSVYDKFII